MKRLAPLRFQGKVIAVLMASVCAVQLATLVVVQVVTERSVRNQLGEQLRVGGRVWQCFHEGNDRQQWRRQRDPGVRQRAAPRGAGAGARAGADRLARAGRRGGRRLRQRLQRAHRPGRQLRQPGRRGRARLRHQPAAGCTRRPRIGGAASPWSATCSRPSGVASCAWSTSPRWTLPPTPSPTPRRCCAGTTPRSARRPGRIHPAGRAQGHNMGLRIVAEGIEDARSLALLRGQGCDMAQGYWFSKLLPGEALQAWAAAREVV